jgi:multisubunit Na+/H+ antiporter MnhG subunit
LFAEGDNLAGGVYGTILVTSIVAAANVDEAIWRSLAIVLVTTFVFWLAHVYAHALAASLDDSDRLSGRRVRRIARHEWPILQAAAVPALCLVAGGVGLLEHDTAYWLAVAFGAVALVWWGLLFSRKTGLSRAATVGVVVVNAAFGLAIVCLKVFVDH